MRTCSPWRDLPAELGDWHRTFVRFSRWREKGVWERVAAALCRDADLEQLFIDSTIVRAHQHSAGQIADIEQAEALIKGQSAEFIVADKGYDSDAFVKAISAQDSQPVPLNTPQLTTRNCAQQMQQCCV